jgi:hypothetical protein
MNLKKTFNLRTWGWKQYSIVACIALAIYLTLGIVFAGGGTIPTPPASVPIEMFGAQIQNHRINTKAWSFDYDHAQLAPDGTTGTIEGIRNGIIFKKGKPSLSISAEKITLDVESLDFTAVGKVHVEKIDDPEHRTFSFDTDLVTWTNNAKQVRLDHPAYIHSGDQTLRMDGGTVDFDAETFHIGKLNGGVDLHK